MEKLRLVLYVFIGMIFLDLLHPFSSLAYTANMSASTVLGQQDLIHASANQGGSVSASTLSAPRGLAVCNGKLVVADSNNNRVLIWNTIPTQNTTPADVVIGQPDMTSNSVNNGGISGATLSSVWGVSCTGNKLMVADINNNRVLIFNKIPTANGVNADIVVGQPNMGSSTANNGGRGANTLSAPGAIANDGQRLFILDSTNRRLLIYNSIPTSNNTSADVVIGEPSFSTMTIACTQTDLGEQPLGLYVGGGKIIVGDTFGNGSNGDRVLIWNSIPTTNNAPADVVVGQTSFTSCTGSTGSTRLNDPFNVFVDNKERLMIADRNNRRILIYNTIPSSNGASADSVIGQSNFTNNSVNQGQSSPGANTLSGARMMTTFDNKLFVGDGDNNRVLVFEDALTTPSLTITSTEGRDNGYVRLHGNTNTSENYAISSVGVAVNGGGTSGAIATDGIFDTSSEDFYFDIDPKSNGNNSPGYVVKVKATNNNMDVTDNFLYFTPFNINSPANNTILTSGYPTFDFSVNTQRDAMKNSMSKYQIQIKPTGASSWTTLIDDIVPDHDNGTVETSNYIATYSDNSSRISVKSKVNSISGSVSWKVVAVDKSGHGQETETRTISSSATASHFFGSYFFPLVLTKVAANKLNYSGIAFANSKITLNLTDTKTNLVKTYITTANSSSRFNLNIPWQDIKTGRKYQVDLSATKDDKYNQLPSTYFTLSSSTPKAQVIQTETVVPVIELTPIPTPVPVTPTPLPTPKRCFLFWCK